MPRVKLDAAFCLTATCEPGRHHTTYFDTIISGFILEVHPSGTRTFALRYFDANKKQRQYKIGRFGDISFEQAKKAAKRLRAEVVLGNDPSAEKEQRRAIPTYATLADQHLTYAKAHLKSYSSTEINIRVHLLPRWGKLKLNEITPQEISKWLVEKAASGLAPSTVEKIRVLLGRSFELGLKWSMPGCERNPVRAVPKAKFNNARDRYLTTDETTRLLKACDRSNNPQLGNIVRLLLLTGARVSELLQAEWRHVNVERASWHIPMSKTGKPRYVPLSSPALEIIENLPRFANCPYVLPNPKTRMPYTDIKHPWQTARKAALLTDLRIHDLRHSAASFMINAGVNLYAVGKVLGHADHQSTQRYAHLANDTLLAAVEAGAAQLKGGWCDHYTP